MGSSRAQRWLRHPADGFPQIATAWGCSVRTGNAHQVRVAAMDDDSDGPPDLVSGGSTEDEAPAPARPPPPPAPQPAAARSALERGFLSKPQTKAAQPAPKEEEFDDDDIPPLVVSWYLGAAQLGASLLLDRSCVRSWRPVCIAMCTAASAGAPNVLGWCCPGAQPRPRSRNAMLCSARCMQGGASLAHHRRRTGRAQALPNCPCMPTPLP